MKQLFIGSENVLHQIKGKRINYGEFVSNDWFYNIINQFIDDNLMKYSRFLCFCVLFLFRSSNYRHINFKGSKLIHLIRFVDALCWICFFIFIGLLLTGVAAPIISEIKQWHFDQIFKNAAITWIFILEVICIVVSFCYMFILRRKIALNRRMTLADYVTAKIGLIINLDFIFKIRNRFYNRLKKEKNHNNLKTHISLATSQIYIVTGLEKLSTLGDIWLLMQITNVMYYLFSDFNLVLQMKTDDENFVQRIRTIVHQDFQHMKLLIISPANNV